MLAEQQLLANLAPWSAEFISLDPILEVQGDCPTTAEEILEHGLLIPEETEDAVILVEEEEEESHAVLEPPVPSFAEAMTG